MAIRVTQQSMYNTMVSQMQSTLAAYMESNEQGSTQKKINRPSDDPAGTYRVS
jgi:flagellar hook-associated protein 3 FlgL